MAKRKKKSTRSRKKQSAAPQHVLPNGFWAQVGAVVLIALAALLVVTWFDAGGPVLNWLAAFSFKMIGYASYVLPFLFLYIGIEIFRAEDNRIPFLFKFASVLFVLWLAGLFGLAVDAVSQTSGGLIGKSLNTMMSAFVTNGVGIFIYALLLAITSLFMFRVSPGVVIAKIADLFRTGSSEDEANVSVMRKAAKTDTKESAPIVDLNINSGVSMEEGTEAKKGSRLAGSKIKSPQQDKPTEPQSALVTVNDPNWEGPSLELLEKKQSPPDPGDIQQNAQTIRDTLSEFNIEVEMEGANIGPRVTQYTLKPPSGVKLSRISALETNLALNLAASALRIEAPIPGQRAVGIEVPNRKAADVRIRGILESKEWRASREPLSFAIGKDISGEPVVGELNKMPHLLIAGQTGAGKSVMINSLLCSLLYRNSPSQMKLILVDPKQVEMSRYKDIPHLLTPIITQPEKAISALKWAVNEMERRYELLAEVGEVNIKDYNSSLTKSRKSKKIAVQDEDGETITDQPAEDGAMPYIVVIIDEMFDLMMTAGRDVEGLIARLAAKARAVGIHLVLATQSPRADVITGLIKANIPAQIAFTVGNQVESRIIIDAVGAEKLLGMGDMLFKTASMSKFSRIQGAFIENDEVKKIADHLRMQSAPQYNDEIISQPVQINAKGGMVMDMDGGSGDSEYQDAVRVVVEMRKASTSLLQRRLRIGYSKAARIIEEMEEQGIIGPADGSRPREVLISSMDDLE